MDNHSTISADGLFTREAGNAADSSLRKYARAPIALSIAGSDSGGGAGIQADLKTFSALGVFGATVITAITAQNTRAVTAICETPLHIVAAQIRAVFDDLQIGVVKVGMLGSPELIAEVARQLHGIDCPLVLDPVMVAKSGDSLLKANALSSMRELLVPMAALLTPNLPEAARLLECREAVGEAEAEAQGRALLDLGAQAVLMKGGHAEGDLCVDLLIQREQPVKRIAAPRIDTRNTHGTGCTLSSAIAAGLAKGFTLEVAFVKAHTYLQGAIKAADRLQVGAGHGPVHHFFETWSD